MLHHAGINVRDLEKSIAFWTPFRGLLRYEEERWSQGANDRMGAQEPERIEFEVVARSAT